MTQVKEVKGDDVVCLIKNSDVLARTLYTLHASQIHIDLPTLIDKDKEVISMWGAKNNVNFLSLSHTRSGQDAREYLSKLGGLSQTQIFAKIENVEGLVNFDEILQEAYGIILARGNLGIDLPPEKVSTNLTILPTRAEATDVANAVLDGADAILLGAETMCGLYPLESISIVGKICGESEKVYNQDSYFKKTVKYVGEPMSHLESIASSAVRAVIKVKASVIICFTSSGRAARLIAKYRPTMHVLSVVIPRLKTNQLRWTFTGAFERNLIFFGKKSRYSSMFGFYSYMLNVTDPRVVFDDFHEKARQSLIIRGLFPMLADPRHPAKSTSATNKTVLKVALDHGRTIGVIKPHDRVVVCQKVGDDSVDKIIELEE
ncbi:pyruvate kinase 1, cytosolic-like protein [Tanacetum coccineum]